MQIRHYTPKTTPYRHQIAALENTWDREGYGWLMEMGTGKSKVCVDDICMLREDGGLQSVLILAPKGTYGNWYHKEIPAHMPDRHRETTVMHLWMGGGSRRERESLEYMMQPNDGVLRILIMNIEAVSMSDRAAQIAAQFVSRGACLTAVDESSTIKNPQAVRTKRIIMLGRASRWRRIMTGSPVTRSPLDLWSQFEFLYPQCLGHKSFYSFRSRYAIMERKDFGGRKVDIVVGHRDTDHLSRLIATKSFVVRKEDCLDLPPKIFTRREVQLTKEQERLYLELKNYATAQLANGEFVSATQVITQLLRMQQICSGHVVSEEGGIVDVPTGRLDHVDEIVDETSGPIIWWCNFRRDIDKVMERLRKLGRSPVRYDGTTGEEERAEAVLRFQGVYGDRTCPDHARATDFVGTPSAGGYGITLTAASTVVYYSNSYDLEKRLQSEDRAHRIGQEKSVTYIDLVSPGTVDEKILEVLMKKQTLANLIMDGPARVRELFGIS